MLFRSYALKQRKVVIDTSGQDFRTGPYFIMHTAFVRPRVVVGKYLEIFQLGVWKSSGLLKANREMSLPTLPKLICGRYPKSSTGKRRVSHVSRS